MGWNGAEDVVDGRVVEYKCRVKLVVLPIRVHEEQVGLELRAEQMSKIPEALKKVLASPGG